jgi:hypothetical protein
VIRKMEKSFIKEASSILANTERLTFGLLILSNSVVNLLLFFFLSYELKMLFLELFRQASQNPFVLEQFQSLHSGSRVPMLLKKYQSKHLRRNLIKSSSGGFYSASAKVLDAGLLFLECSFKLS